jgi:hypothetical protein
VADISLSDAYEKARWARHLYDSLGPEIEALQKRDDHRITVEVNADTGEYILGVFDLPTPDPEWGLRIGDCLHNARVALDYLMVRLYALGTGEDPKNVKAIQFPVCDSPGTFDRSPTVKHFRSCPSLAGYLARVEELQPFNAGDPSIWTRSDPLSRSTRHAPVTEALTDLARWDNIDKHRVIHAALLRPAIQPERIPHPPGFRLVHDGSDWRPLEDGAQIGRWVFETPLPFVWTPAEVDMKRYFSIAVSLSESWATQPVLQVLPFCLWGVDQVLAIFDPVFTEGESPLPVTAI